MEVRSLLSVTASTFHAPELGRLADAAKSGASIIPAAFSAWVGLLQDQLETAAPRDTVPATLTADVNQIVSVYETSASQTYAQSNPRLNTLLQYQGEDIRAAIDSYDEQLNTGLINTSSFNQDAFLSLQELTLSRKIWPVGTPGQEFLVRSWDLQGGLQTLIANLGAGGSAQLTNGQAAAVVNAEAYAYQTDMLLGGTRMPYMSRTVGRAVDSLVTQVNAAVGGTDFLGALQSAEQTYSAAIVNPEGLFGPGGSMGRHIQQPSTVPDPLPIDTVANFTNLQYKEVKTSSAWTVYRNFSIPANKLGHYLSPNLFATPSAAIRKLALDQSWYYTNPATSVVNVTIPANATIYIGKVAPIYEGVYRREASPTLYPGNATQIYVPSSLYSSLVLTDARPTGT